MKVLVNGQYTYETDLDVQVGDDVILPTPSFLRDVKGPTWEGRVTSLNSDYTGWCERIISLAPKFSEEEIKILEEKENAEKLAIAIERREDDANYMAYWKLPKHEKSDKTKQGKWEVFAIKTPKGASSEKIEVLKKSSTAKGAKEIAMEAVNNAIPIYHKKIRGYGIPKDRLPTKEESYPKLAFDLLIIRNPKGEPYQWCDLKLGKNTNDMLSWNKFPKRDKELDIEM
jgi:hypothetical protein